MKSQLEYDKFLFGKSGDNQVFKEAEKPGLNHLQSFEISKYIFSTYGENIGQNKKNCPINFSSNNPFFHLQKALRVQPYQNSTQKNQLFLNMKGQINEMKKMCQKFMKNDQEIQAQYNAKTLIMDLQNLQSRRTEIEGCAQQLEKSNISIQNLIENQQTEKLCHRNCDQINSIIQKASSRIEQLSAAQQLLEKQLERQTEGKEDALALNKFLRQQISKLDEIKCDEIQKLKKQLHKLKMKQHNEKAKIYEVGRTPTQNNSSKQLQLSQKENNFFKNSHESKLQESPNISKKSSRFQRSNIQIKLKNLVYL